MQLRAAQKTLGAMNCSMDNPPAEPEDRVSERLAFTGMVRDIVVACLAQTPVKPNDIPKLIADVEEALLQVAQGERQPREKLQPAVPIENSIQDAFLVCLEDGAKVKSLKTYLKRHHNLSPEQYINRWGLPDDYPMVAPSYSRARSDIAKRNSLGGRIPKRPGRPQ